jgi:hypothetical protein
VQGEGESLHTIEVELDRWREILDVHYRQYLNSL